MLPIKLRQSIEAAFENVTLGDGIGLWQAQAIDDYENEKGQLAARNRDEKLDWKTISGNDLIRCNSSLSFFDADGMRFHLPAFILSDEFHEHTDSLIYSLTCLNDYVLNMFSSLTTSQRKVVTEYLIWCKNHKDYEFEKEEIERSLKEFWNEN